MRRIKVILVLLSLFVLVTCDEDEGGNSGSNGGRVVFLGASITESWDFDHYFGGHDFRKVIYYDWKKSDAWDQVWDLHPQYVVVKECAAYFYTEGGTPLNEYYAEIQNLVALTRAAGATPVLATTIPVDVGFGGCTQQQLDDIRTFNNWLRSYCATNHVICMDLYGAVADASGQLPRDCHDGDGLHPNSRGYDKLSPAVLPALRDAGYNG